MSTDEIPFSSSGSGDSTERRRWCPRCHQPGVACYCPLIEAFDSDPRFIILTQPREAKHRFGTGRMAHLCLSNSLLFEGVDFSANNRVNAEILNPASYPVLLYPSADAIKLSRLTPAELIELVPGGRKLVVIVLDGTWKSARKMIRLSRNLADFPRIRFDPPSPSGYRIRRQPAPHCYSTIEAIHYVTDLFSGPGNGRKPHDNLLKVFRSVIDRQLTYTP
jgi:DTW domain-containing protein YfiP